MTLKGDPHRISLHYSPPSPALSKYRFNIRFKKKEAFWCHSKACDFYEMLRLLSCRLELFCLLSSMAGFKPQLRVSNIVFSIGVVEP